MASRRASSGLLLGGAFAPFTISAGLMHSYAVFLGAFLEDFRWSRAEASLAYSTSQLVAGASSPLVGTLVDWLRARPRLLVGARALSLPAPAHLWCAPSWTGSGRAVSCCSAGRSSLSVSSAARTHRPCGRWWPS